MSKTEGHPYQVVLIDGVECVSPKTASLYLNVHINTIYNRINSRFGYLDHRDFDGRPMVTVESLEREKLRLDAERGATEPAAA